jgi:hypothetical protein
MVKTFPGAFFASFYGHSLGCGDSRVRFIGVHPWLMTSLSDSSPEFSLQLWTGRERGQANEAFTSTYDLLVYFPVSSRHKNQEKKVVKTI